MQDAVHASSLGTLEEGKRIRLGLTGMQHHGLCQFLGEGELCIERVQLTVARRMRVMSIKTTLTDRDGSARHGLADSLRVGGIAPRCRVVRVDASREEDETRMAFRQQSRTSRGGRRLTDTDKGPRTSGTGPFDHRARVVGERGIGQMHMTVTKDGHRFLLRGEVPRLPRTCPTGAFASSVHRPTG